MWLKRFLERRRDRRWRPYSILVTTDNGKGTGVTRFDIKNGQRWGSFVRDMEKHDAVWIGRLYIPRFYINMVEALDEQAWQRYQAEMDKLRAASQQPTGSLQNLNLADLPMTRQ